MMTQNLSSAIELYRKVGHIRDVVRELGPLPQEAIIFGIAKSDGLPVMYNVSDKVSPHIMVWDRLVGQGLRLIKVVIEFILRYKDQSKYHTEFVIISNHTKEWLRLSEHGLGVWNKNECIAVVPFWDTVADQVLYALSGWCLGVRDSKSPVFLFIDGFENVLRMGDEAQHSIRAILELGRKKNVYVIGTARSELRKELSAWLDFFQREIYGQEELEYFEYQEGRIDGRPQMVLFWTPETEI